AVARFSLEAMVKAQTEVYEKIASGVPKGKAAKGKSLKEAKSPQAYDAVLSGYYGFSNSGDEALLMSIIRNLRSHRPEIRLLVLSRTPAQTKAQYSVDCVNRLSIIRIARIMKRSRLLINGGGNLIQDDTSTHSLIYYLGITWLAGRMGAKTMLYANGIGPVGKRLNKRLSRRILNRVDVITLREALSERELAGMGVTRPRISVTADPVLTIDPSPAKALRAAEAEGLPEGAPLLAISVRNWKHSAPDFEQTMAKAADYARERHGLTPVLIPMQHPHDLAISSSIASRMAQPPFMVRGRHEAEQLMGVISRCALVIGMRLHSLIYAANGGVPAIGIVYEPKVQAFIDYFGQSSAGLVEDLTFEALAGRIDEVWAARGSIMPDMARRGVELRRKAMENASIAIGLLEGGA
ncbi:MAG: polysaccharide pyruvyl transferase CsaB, partial [Oscillospiraceae bacterium]|nr:polysaccharide pyruvyl transferase CsaB [Oscillospiraceae bacterium]